MTKKIHWILISWLSVLGLGTAWAGSTAVLKVGDSISTGQTITVCTGATATESGTLLLKALSSITDASSSKPYLIRIEPGSYDVGSSSVQMKEYVVIEGAGEGVTTITGNVNMASSGVVNGADNAELRRLTVVNTSAMDYGYAIYNSECSPAISFVTAQAGQADHSCGVYNSGTSSNIIRPVMTNVSATVSGGIITTPFVIFSPLPG
jgi:hypothetical protein